VVILNATSFLEGHKNTRVTHKITHIYIYIYIYIYFMNKPLNFDQVVILNATSFLEGHKDTRVTHRITHIYIYIMNNFFDEIIIYRKKRANTRKVYKRAEFPRGLL